MKNIIKLYWRLFMLVASLLSSCGEYVEIDAPNTYVIGEKVYVNEQLATAAVDGIYHQLYSSGTFAGGWQNSVTVLSGLSADEFLVGPYSLEMKQFYDNQILPSNNNCHRLWSSAYNIIYMTNAVLEGLEGSDSISGEIKQVLMAEVKFLRAFSYFNLVNLFGDVPLILKTDYRENSLVGRHPRTEVYDQIVEDLLYARDWLKESYRNDERTYPNRFAASALLARVQLYLENWSKAETYATEVISSSQYILESDLDMVFLANGQEAIWQLSPNKGGNTREGSLFILAEPPTSSFYYPVYLDKELVNGFELDDLRLSHWVGILESGEETYHYPFKYKVSFSTSEPVEYSMVMRLAEQYLIRGEARMRQGKLDLGREDLNVIRIRAGLGAIPMDTAENLVETLYEERRKELFTEWGHRWFDLNRSGRAETTLGINKPNWQSTDRLYPIPELELGKIPNLEQNGGY